MQENQGPRGGKDGSCCFLRCQESGRGRFSGEHRATLASLDSKRAPGAGKANGVLPLRNSKLSKRNPHNTMLKHTDSQRGSAETGTDARDERWTPGIGVSRCHGLRCKRDEWLRAAGRMSGYQAVVITGLLVPPSCQLHESLPAEVTHLPLACPLPVRGQAAPLSSSKKGLQAAAPTFLHATPSPQAPSRTVLWPRAG